MPSLLVLDLNASSGNLQNRASQTIQALHSIEAEDEEACALEPDPFLRASNTVFVIFERHVNELEEGRSGSDQLLSSVDKSERDTPNSKNSKSTRDSVHVTRMPSEKRCLRESTVV